MKNEITIKWYGKDTQAYVDVDGKARIYDDIAGYWSLCMAPRIAAKIRKLATA